MLPCQGPYTLQEYENARKSTQCIIAMMRYVHWLGFQNCTNYFDIVRYLNKIFRVTFAVNLIWYLVLHIVIAFLQINI